MKFGLSEKTLEIIQKIFQQHPEITRVQIFGSRAKGNYHASSDIDLVISGNITESLLAKVAAELDELPLPYIFDVKSNSAITHQALHEHIHQFGKDVYTKPA